MPPPRLALACVLAVFTPEAGSREEDLLIAVSPVLMNMSAGGFHEIPRIDDARLAEIFSYGPYANAHRGLVRRGRDSNPRYTLRRTRAFQARSLNRSDTSPPQNAGKRWLRYQK